jgi:hypothetical protein
MARGPAILASVKTMASDMIKGNKILNATAPPKTRRAPKCEPFSGSIARMLISDSCVSRVLSSMSHSSNVGKRLVENVQASTASPNIAEECTS